MLLPFDTQSEEQPTVRATLALSDDYKVLGIVGAASSTESQAASLIAEIFDVPVMSYSSTSAVLSDKIRFRTFFRTVPPDSFQARAVVDICRKARIRRVVVIHTIDNYGTSLNSIFQSLATTGATPAENIEVTKTLTIQTTGAAADIVAALRLEMDKIDADLDKVFVVFSLAADAARVLDIARTKGLLNGEHHFIGVDGVMQASLLVNLQGGAATDNSTWNDKHLAAAGIIGTLPSSGNSTDFQNFLALWQSKTPDQYHGTGAGKVPNLFAPFAYDCVLAYAHAIAKILAANDGNEAFLNAANVTEVLKTTDVTGVTGQVTFDMNNDRAGSTYDIRNFQLQADGTTKLVTVGAWTPSTGAVLTGDVQYAVNVGTKQVTTDLDVVRRIRCDAFEVSDGLACRACGESEIFVAGDTAELSKCESCPANFVPSEDKTTCQLTSGLVALIAVVVIVAVLAAVLALAFYLKTSATKRKKAELAAQSTPAHVWELQSELDEVQGAETPTPSSAGIITTLQNGAPVTVLMKTGEVPMFGVSKGSRMPVMEARTDEIVITNRGNSDVAYSVFVPNGNGAYAVGVTPGVGHVKKQSSRTLTIAFTLQQTMKVDRYIKVDIETHGAVYFPLRFEGELSQRLDPDEIELFGKPIGDGAFGTVYRGRYRGTAVAVKVLRRQNELAADQNNNFLKEIALFQKLRNPFIVSFIGASYIPGKLCICTELLERGTVLELIQKARISLALKYKLMIDTARAIEFLHSNGVLYRDLKPDNLLVFSVSHNASVNCKLSDFGTSRIVEDPRVLVNHSSGIGTPIYMAPEMMDATQKYNLKVDVYSFGMLVWELMAEKQPFNEVKRIWDLPRIVVDGLRPTIDESWPRPIQRLITEAWMHTAERRPTMKEALAVLTDVFEAERRTYEKAKKMRREGGDEPLSADAARNRTAHTGNLEELIVRSANALPNEVPADTSAYLAPIADSGSGKKKANKKKKKAQIAAAEEAAKDEAHSE